MEQRAFHLVLPEAFRANPSPTEWSPSSLAATTEGFVHLSFAEQLRGTVDLHFRDGDELWLLEVDRHSIAPDVRLEPSRDSQLFPHLYRSIRFAEIRAWWRLQRDDSGRWVLPKIAALPSEDLPQGTDGLPS